MLTEEINQDGALMVRLGSSQAGSRTPDVVYLRVADIIHMRT